MSLCLSEIAWKMQLSSGVGIRMFGDGVGGGGGGGGGGVGGGWGGGGGGGGLQRHISFFGG